MTTITSTTPSTTPSTTSSSTGATITPTTTATGATTTSSVNTAGGTTYLTGTASGLNTQAMITAAVQQYLQPATTLQAQVTTNQTKIAAYQQLQTLINNLTTSMSKLAQPAVTVSTSSGSDFQNKTGSLTASDGSNASSYLTASATTAAVATSYTMSVDQLAEAQTVASTAMSQSTALGFTGSFSISEASGTAQTITVSANMSLSDIANAVNTVSNQTGVGASIVKDSSGNYRLVLSANDTNQPITTSVVSGSDVMNQLGFTNSSGAFANVLQAAQPALVTIDGNQVSNSTNNLTDAISGLTLQLTNKTPTGVTLNMNVTPDPSAATTDINNFITAYNSLRAFISTNQQVNSDGTINTSTEPLFADSLLTSTSQMLNSLISTPTSSSSGAYKSLSDLGITLDNNNNLSISNQTTFNNAMQGSLASVASMFQTSYTPSNTSLQLLTNNTTSAFNFTMNVTANPDGTLAGVSVNGDSSMFTVNGNSIVGNTGTPYAGLTFALVATQNTSIQVSIQPGLANQIDNFATQYASTASGLIQNAITALTTQDDSWNTQISTIQANASAYQTQLVNKYAQMEATVSAAQVVQAQIKALLQGSTYTG